MRENFLPIFLISGDHQNPQGYELVTFRSEGGTVYQLGPSGSAASAKKTQITVRDTLCIIHTRFGS